MKLSSEESLRLDYLKAIGIFFVIIGHYKGWVFPVMRPYYFHMQLFFFLAGITLNESKKTTTFIYSLSRKIIPYSIYTYIIIGSLSLLISNYYGIYLGKPFFDGVMNTINHAFDMNYHNNELFIVMWFLQTYYLSIILTFTIIKLLKSINTNKMAFDFVLFSLAILECYIGITYFSEMYNTNKFQIYNVISQTLVSSSFIILGYLFGNKFFKINNFYLITILYIILIFASSYYKIDVSVMSWSKYNSGFLNSIIIPIACICICFYISKIMITFNINKIIRIIGIRSRDIMSYHMLSFIIIDILFSYFGLWDMKQSTSTKHFMFDYSIIIYTLFGLIFPMLIFSLYEYFLRFIKSII